MTPFKYAQKNVPSSSIVPGDQIFRTSRERGDLMLHVESVSRGTHQGQEVCIWRGIAYKLAGSGSAGSGSGASPIFLGEITGERVGTDGGGKSPSTVKSQGAFRKKTLTTNTEKTPEEDSAMNAPLLIHAEAFRSVLIEMVFCPDGPDTATGTDATAGQDSNTMAYGESSSSTDLTGKSVSLRHGIT